MKQDELDDLAKKVRAILNKLTPQKFTTLVEQFQELPIDSQSKLTSSMELIFEKVMRFFDVALTLIDNKQFSV